MSYYLHELPGRLRIKIPSLKRNPFQALRLQGVLDDISGVASVSSNLVTGSIVVKFDSAIVSSREIMDVLSREGCIDLGELIKGQQGVDPSLSKAGAVASRALLGLAIETAFEGSPLTLLAVLI
jgi:copper chaperone CopZ